jgi:hypothetical protein
MIDETAILDSRQTLAQSLSRGRDRDFDRRGPDFGYGGSLSGLDPLIDHPLARACPHFRVGQEFGGRAGGLLVGAGKDVLRLGQGLRPLLSRIGKQSLGFGFEFSRFVERLPDGIGAIVESPCQRTRDLCASTIKMRIATRTQKAPWVRIDEDSASYSIAVLSIRAGSDRLESLRDAKRLINPLHHTTRRA